MKNINIGNSGIEVSEIGLGCMRMADLEKSEAEKIIKTALDEGINFFDHADIYGGGKSEEVFADAINMNATIREKMIIQTKCGIVPGVMYDFSKEHILNSVDASLKRLKTDYVDTLFYIVQIHLWNQKKLQKLFLSYIRMGRLKNLV